MPTADQKDTVPGRYFAPITFTDRFPALDGVRAFALMMVFFVHYGGGARGGRLLNIVNAIRLHERGGIDVFFVLSGFLITGILYDTRLDSHFFRRFYARRTLRIFPAFYLVAAIVLLLTPVFHYQWRWEQITFLLYVGNFHASFQQSLYRVPSLNHPYARLYLGHLWSLCVEEQFYLLWPFLVWKIADRARLLRTAAWISLGALALRILVVTLTPWRQNWEWIEHTLPFRSDDLLVGAILAMILRGPSADWWQRRAKWFFLVGFALGSGIFILWPDPISPQNQTFGTAFTAIASAGLIASALRPASLACRFFSIRPLLFLGRYTYCFYICHLLWADAWHHFQADLVQRLHSSAVAGAISLTVNFSLTLLVSMLSYHLVESRFLRLKRFFIYDSETRRHKHPSYVT